jgi:hypothetical protein
MDSSRPPSPSSRPKIAPPPTLGSAAPTPTKPVARPNWRPKAELAASSVVAEIEPDEILVEPEAEPARPPTPPPAPRAPVAPVVAPQVVAPRVVAPQVVAPTLPAAPIAAAQRPAPTPAAAPVNPQTAWGIAVHPAAASSAALAPAASQTSMPRKLPSWWRVTAISAGASAALTFAIVLLGSDPASASTPTVETPAPISVTYDPSLIEAPAPAPVVAAPAGIAESERVLARRIALRGTRNAAGGLPRLARAAFEEALQHDPSCRPALAGLGKIAFEAGRWREASEHLEAALKIEPRDTESREMLATAHEKLGRHRSAARHQRRAEDSR